ncbi:MAG: FAD-dependent oxidoreductase [Campylobacteraceae bacterium]|jgi:malate dehydrogenase (quinone)|nr:FAD-dependent oxidoreductase [Campylobacteraceae bacterium]
MTEKHYDVVIVGGGISGSALFYTLAKYSDIKSVALLEKYDALATLSSSGRGNSQTIHTGDIETNYTLAKAKHVKRAANMIRRYCLQHGYENKFMFIHQKMAVGIGDKEVEYMKKRYEEFKELFPYLEVYDKEKLKEVEPKLVFDENGNERPEDIVGVGVLDQYSTVNYGAMAQSLVDNAQKEKNKQLDIFFNSEVVSIKQLGKEHVLMTKSGDVFTADFVVVDAGGHALYLAHKMGYGKEFGCLPVAGSYYVTKSHFLKGKVYMVQNPKLPFAALHGDPDVLLDMATRFGPTALVLPVLERFHGLKSFPDFLKTLNLDFKILKILKDMFADSDIRRYIFRNFFYEIPYFNKRIFLKDMKKLVPCLKLEDIEYAKGFGGVRPQVLNKPERKLMLGEASINPGTGIIFNMTPSPGATSCLGNAERDAQLVCEHLGAKFNTKAFADDLVDE